MRQHHVFAPCRLGLARAPAPTPARSSSTIRYFKQLAEETGVRYQTLINLYLRDCAASGRKLALTWKPAA